MADGAKKARGETRGDTAPTSFFKGVKREFSRIMWPTREDVFKQTLAVVILSMLCGVSIALLDMGFSSLVNLLSSIG